MTTTPTSGAAIQRYKIGYREDEWGQRSSTPSGIPDASGSWVRYEDHIAALAAGQATAAPAQPAQQAPAGESLRTDALCDLSYSHGLKAGWNYCASDDLAGFERAQKIGTEALRTIKSPTAQADSVQEDAARWREHVGKLDALVAYCPTCCQGFIAKQDMTRDEVLFACGKAVGQSGAKRLREALDLAVDHIDMDALRISHCKDAAVIDAARKQGASQ